MCQCSDGSFANYGEPCRGGGGNRASNIPSGSVSCGGGRFCPRGTACASHNKCMPAGSADCGSYTCNSGSKCSTGGGCVPKESADCGGGHYCTKGMVCIGTEKCGTQQQADAVREAEKKKIEEAARDAVEAKRLHAEQQQSLRDQIKKSDTSQKQGLKEQLQNKLKEAQEAKQAAAGVSSGNQQTTATVLNPGAQAGPQASVAPVTPSISAPAPAPSYTFAQTQYGTVEVFQNGQRISTMTPQAAATQYGYQVPSGTPAQSPQTTAAPLITGPVTTPSGAIVDAGTGKLIVPPPAANSNAAAGQASCSAWGSFDSSGSASGAMCGNSSTGSFVAANAPTAQVAPSTTLVATSPTAHFVPTSTPNQTGTGTVIAHPASSPALPENGSGHPAVQFSQLPIDASVSGSTPATQSMARPRSSTQEN